MSVQMPDVAVAQTPEAEEDATPCWWIRSKSLRTIDITMARNFQSLHNQNSTGWWTPLTVIPSFCTSANSPIQLPRAIRSASKFSEPSTRHSVQQGKGQKYGLLVFVEISTITGQFDVNCVSRFETSTGNDFGDHFLDIDSCSFTKALC